MRETHLQAITMVMPTTASTITRLSTKRRRHHRRKVPRPVSRHRNRRNKRHQPRPNSSNSRRRHHRQITRDPLQRTIIIRATKTLAMATRTRIRGK